MTVSMDLLEFKPLFFAPFVSSVMRVEPDWINYNGHLNMAYYHVLFDRAFDEVLRLIGADPDYVRWLIPLTQVALDVVCCEVGRVRSPGRTHDGQGALAFRIPEGIF